MKIETIEKVRKSIPALSIENAYKNIAYFSGWIIQKPRFIKHDKTGRESVSLILVQFMRDPKGWAYLKSFNLISFVTPLIERLKKQKKICFIICDCQLQWNNKSKQTYPQMYEMKINYELDLELEDEESEN